MLRVHAASTIQPKLGPRCSPAHLWFNFDPLFHDSWGRIGSTSSVAVEGRSPSRSPAPIDSCGASRHVARRQPGPSTDRGHLLEPSAPRRSMVVDPATLLRNVGVIAHINAGKTTLSESILFVSKLQSTQGRVEEGTATMDYLPEEQRRGISIAAAVARVPWRGHTINLIDTPGHVDFGVEVDRSLQVLDGVVVLLDGVKGVESQTRGVWRAADRFELPRLVFVNKLDRPTADFEQSVLMVEDSFGVRALPLVVPIRRGGELCGLHDLVTGQTVCRAGTPVDIADDHSVQRGVLLELAAEHDDGILDDLVHGREPSVPAVYAALRRATLERMVMPVLAGAALTNEGVPLLLDAICRYLPTPRERARRMPELATQEPTASLVAREFRTLEESDGAFHLIRVFSGEIRAGQELCFHSSSGSGYTRVLGLARVVGPRRDAVEYARTGEVVGARFEVPVPSGATLFTGGRPIELSDPVIPEPILVMRLEANESAETAKVLSVARRLAAEDPSLRVHEDAELGGVVVAGMGELHLEVFASRVESAAGSHLRLHQPMIAMRRTIATEAVAEAVAQRKLSDGSMCRASIRLRIVPRSDTGEVRLLGREIPSSLGVSPGTSATSWLHGWTGGDPFVGMDIVIEDLQVTHPDSDASLAAQSDALGTALHKALASVDEVRLEPIVSLDLSCPADVLSGVLADLRARSCEIVSVDSDGPGREAHVMGRVALGGTLGYATRLRSLSRGLGTYQLSPIGYAPSGAFSSGAKREIDASVLDRTDPAR